MWSEQKELLFFVLVLNTLTAFLKKKKPCYRLKMGRRKKIFVFLFHFALLN